MLRIDNNYMTRSDGVVLKRTYSDNGYYIMTQNGVYYNEAIDVPTCPNIYFETPFSIDEYDINGDIIYRKNSDIPPEEEPQS